MLASTGGIAAHIQLMQRRQQLAGWLHATSYLSAAILHAAWVVIRTCSSSSRASSHCHQGHASTVIAASNGAGPLSVLLPQAELFDLCGISDLVEAAVDGYNVTGESAVHWCKYCLRHVSGGHRDIQLGSHPSCSAHAVVLAFAYQQPFM